MNFTEEQKKKIDIGLCAIKNCKNTPRRGRRVCSKCNMTLHRFRHRHERAYDPYKNLCIRNGIQFMTLEEFKNHHRKLANLLPPYL